MEIEKTETATGGVPNFKWKLIAWGIHCSYTFGLASIESDILAGIPEGISAALEELIVSNKLELAAEEMDIMNSEVEGVQVQATLVRIRNRGALDK